MDNVFVPPKSRCFWNRYRVDGPEPSNDRAVPTTAGCSVRGAHVSSYLIRTVSRAHSTLHEMRATSARFGLQVGNLMFNTQFEE